MKPAKPEQFFDGLGETLEAKFFYNPLMKITSQDARLIFAKICSECDSTEPRFISRDDSQKKLEIGGKARYLSLRTKPCTPLEAHLLEFNFGYEVVN